MDSTAKPLPTDLPIHAFASANDFETFLEREHSAAPGIYLKFAKKASGIPSIAASEAVEVALCFGWIDGRANGIDTNWWLVRYTPRRHKSLWSKKNVETIARLEKEGRIREAGLAAVNAAKADGRWDRAYAGPATIEVPQDFLEVLNRSPAAAAVFQPLTKTERYSVLWRVETASPSARPKRIEAIVQMLAVGRVPGVLENKSQKKPPKTTTTIIKKQQPAKAPKQRKASKMLQDQASKEPLRRGLRPRDKS